MLERQEVDGLSLGSPVPALFPVASLCFGKNLQIHFLWLRFFQLGLFHHRASSSLLQDPQRLLAAFLRDVHTYKEGAETKPLHSNNSF